MTPDEVVIESANAAVRTVGTDRFRKLTEYALRLVGKEVAAHLRPGDSPGLFAPVDIEVDGKDRTGAILVLEDRVILGWVVGTFKPKNFDAVVPKDTIKSMEDATKGASAFSKERQGLVIDTDGKRWRLTFHAVFEGGRSIVPWLIGVSDGAIRLNFGGDEEVEAGA